MRRAFTILELLAATALTALLMLAVLHVIATIGRSRDATRQQEHSVSWKADLLDTLRRDLLNATSIRYQPNGVVLVGHGALDPGTLAPVDAPVTIAYGLTTIHGRTWLCRRQSPRDGFDGPPAWSELLCPDVTRLTIRRADAMPGTVPAPDERSPEQMVPTAIAVTLDGPDRGSLDELIVVR